MYNNNIMAIKLILIFEKKKKKIKKKKKNWKKKNLTICKCDIKNIDGS